MLILFYRLVKTIEHVVTDNDEPGIILQTCMQSLFKVGDMVRKSGKNRQELRRVQEADANRKIRNIVQDYRCTSVRWNYNEGRLARNVYLFCHYPKMLLANTNFVTIDEQYEWRKAVTEGSRSVLTVRSILPILARGNRWLKIFQCKVFPVVSLILLCIDDLIAIADSIGDLADEDVRINAEMIASKFKSQLLEEYQNDIDSKYLKIAQLFDPRVARRTPSMNDVKELLTHAKVFKSEDNIPIQIEAGGIDDMSDDEEDPLDKDITFFRKKIIHSIRKVVSAPDTVPVEYEYWGGCDRAEDIDVHQFYAYWAAFIPHLFPIILHVLSHRCVSTTPETVFSRGGFVLNSYRTCMTPDRAELSILSAFNYKLKKHSSPTIPILPKVGILSDKELFMYTDGFEEQQPNIHMQDGFADDNILEAVFDSDSEAEDGEYEE